MRFAERLLSLRMESKLSQEDLANIIGISKNSIYFYENEKRVPDINTVKNISKYFKVSTDYILGLTDVKTPETSIRAISDYTGLTENSIKNIKKNLGHGYNFIDEVLGENKVFKDTPPETEVLNLLLEHESLYTLLMIITNSYADYLTKLSKPQYNPDNNAILNEAESLYKKQHMALMRYEEVSDYILIMACNEFKKIIEDNRDKFLELYKCKLLEYQDQHEKNASEQSGSDVDNSDTITDGEQE